MAEIQGGFQGGDPSRRQLGWLLFFRLLVVTLFLGGTIIYQLRSGLGTFNPALPYLYFLVGLFYLQALVVAGLLRSARRPRFIVHLQTVWDLLFSSALILLTGGIESQFSFLYILSIIGASFLLSRKETLFVASASAILYGSLLDLQYYGLLPSLAGLPSAHVVDGRDVFFAVFVNLVAFLLTGLLAGTFSERVRRSELALERRQIDFEELEHLNRTILANIGSGLMMVNPQGRIRSFNEAASRITGYSLQEVYNRQASQLFPELKIFSGRFRSVPRGEGVFTDHGGERHNLGFSSTPVRDRQGRELGLLVTFQDLTQLKEMEQRLQQADRLAAVGQLASGLAHEIRNPLASISGSVQLLLEAGHVNAEGERLMEIVIREADRLSNLLTDFLVFARPKPPRCARVELTALLSEMVSMASADNRFTGVEIRAELPPGYASSLDREQFRQVIWNLMINAAEAMGGEGVLILGIDPEAGVVYVDDSGPGIPVEIRSSIFDPFFTTKDHGSGLGLSTVYAIIEAHGGELSVGTSRLGGARFSVKLPGIP